MNVVKIRLSVICFERDPGNRTRGVGGGGVERDLVKMGIDDGGCLISCKNSQASYHWGISISNSAV